MNEILIGQIWMISVAKDEENGIVARDFIYRIDIVNHVDRWVTVSVFDPITGTFDSDPSYWSGSMYRGIQEGGKPPAFTWSLVPPEQLSILEVHAL